MGLTCSAACRTHPSAATQARSSARAGQRPYGYERLGCDGDDECLRPGSRAVLGWTIPRNLPGPVWPMGRPAAAGRADRGTRSRRSSCVWPRSGAMSPRRSPGAVPLGPLCSCSGDCEGRARLEEGLTLYDPVRDRTSGSPTRSTRASSVCTGSLEPFLPLGFPSRPWRGRTRCSSTAASWLIPTRWLSLC